MSRLPDPSRSIGSLIGELARLFARNFNARVRTHGLTQTQWQALAVLSRREGLRQAELAELLNVQPISLARLIDRMENAGWVERRPDPNDRRAIQLYLRPKVDPIIDEMVAVSLATRAAAMKGFNEAEQEQLLELLPRMMNNLRDSVPPTTADAIDIAEKGNE